MSDRQKKLEQAAVLRSYVPLGKELLEQAEEALVTTVEKLRENADTQRRIEIAIRDRHRQLQGVRREHKGLSQRAGFIRARVNLYREGLALTQEKAELLEQEANPRDPLRDGNGEECKLALLEMRKHDPVFAEAVNKYAELLNPCKRVGGVLGTKTKDDVIFITAQIIALCERLAESCEGALYHEIQTAKYWCRAVEAIAVWRALQAHYGDTSFSVPEAVRFLRSGYRDDEEREFLPSVRGTHVALRNVCLEEFGILEQLPGGGLLRVVRSEDWPIENVVVGVDA